MPRKKMILVGLGGWGSRWCSQILPPNLHDGTVEVVAAVDLNEQLFVHPCQHLKLRPDQCFTSLGRALEKTRADFVAVVVPPAAHEQVIDEAIAHDLDILCEKPIADTLDAAIRVARKVQRAGRKMAITMSHRFDQDKSTLRAQLRSGRHGRLDYLVYRYSAEWRNGGLGTYVYQIEDPLLIDMAVHHFDILADLAGGECESVYCQTWNPSWSTFRHHANGLAMLSFSGGVRALYEGANTNAVSMNDWSEDYIRAECEGATLILSNRRLEVMPFMPHDRTTMHPGDGEAVPLLSGSKWMNALLVEKFVDWLEGGPPMETHVQSNLRSLSTVFAAIESSRVQRPIRPSELLAAHGL